ncbi:MAG: Uma2 family endonuclease, partial [Bacteroidetes bacterium]
MVNYILNNEIDYFPNIYSTFMTTFKHSRIIRNTRIRIEKRVEGQEIIVYSEGRNMLMIGGNVRIPDIVVVNEKEIMDIHDNLQNPLAAFEVLSPSTAHIDFTEKLAEYKKIPTLQTYIIISQNEP